LDVTDYQKFWRGEFSLGQAFWIMYFGINCALGFAVLLLMFVLNIFKIQSLVTIIYFGDVIIIVNIKRSRSATSPPFVVEGGKVYKKRARV
jgi:hypothetical protein